MTNDLPQLGVFYGDLTVNRAFVYARLPVPTEQGSWSLVGQVRGPRCLHAQTLPVSSPLVDLGPGPTLLARATLTDPCFWSPDLPAIYDVTVNLLRGGEVVATAHREIGLRALGVRGRFLSLESKRWVLRGVSSGSTTARLSREWHEASAAYIAADPPAVALAEASQWGALTVAEVCGTPPAIAARLRELAAFPAVAIALVRGELPSDFQRATAAPNLLLAQPIGDRGEHSPRSWADLLWWQTKTPLAAPQPLAHTTLPIIACRPITAPLPLPDSRAACDTLQRDLAPYGQFAGYVV